MARFVTQEGQLRCHEGGGDGINAEALKRVLLKYGRVYQFFTVHHPRKIVWPRFGADDTIEEKYPGQSTCGKDDEILYIATVKQKRM